MRVKILGLTTHSEPVQEANTFGCIVDINGSSCVVSERHLGGIHEMYTEKSLSDCGCTSEFKKSVY